MKVKFTPIIKTCILLTILVWISPKSSFSQVVFWTDDFDSDHPSSGDRDAPNHADGDNGTAGGTVDCPNVGDYFVRTNLASGGGISVVMSGFSGSYWRGEDLNGCQANPETINFTGININGLSNFRFTGSFGANPSNLWDIADGDRITIEYRVDGGAFTKGLEFRADATSRLAHDDDLDGTADGAQLGSVLQAFSFTFNVSGTTLDLRLTVSAEDGSEEFGFDNFILEHSLPLPVELMSFKASKMAGHHLLEWKTASEFQNEGFMVQRSIDGIEWKSLSFIKGFGESNQLQHYSFVVKQPVDGVQYYRLKQMDTDGHFTFSSIISLIAPTSTNNISIYPNPSDDGIFYLEYNSEIYLPLQIQVYNNIGQLVYQTAFTISEKQVINLQHLKTGLYLIQLSSQDNYSQSRLVIN